MSEREEGREAGEEEVAAALSLTFGEARSIPRKKRAAAIMRRLKRAAARHVDAETILVSEELAAVIWSRGAGKPPRRVRVRVELDEEEKTATLYPAGD